MGTCEANGLAESLLSDEVHEELNKLTALSFEQGSSLLKNDQLESLVLVDLKPKTQFSLKKTTTTEAIIKVQLRSQLRLRSFDF